MYRLLTIHKSTEITRRRRRILDSQSCVQSPLRQVSDGAINRCHAYFDRDPEQQTYGTPFLADRTATQYDRLLAAACCPSVRLSVTLCIVALRVGVRG